VDGWPLVVSPVSEFPPAGAYFSFFDLRILSPQPIDTYPDGFDANHRVFRAYPGIEYNIRAAVQGGAYPYRFELVNEPAGMTVSANGTIVWSNPTTTATDIELIVTDAFDVEASVTWSITVTTTGFRFVNAVGGSDGNSGTLASPWQTLDKVYDSSAEHDIVYFRAGTYTLAGIAVNLDGDVAGEENIVWAGASGAVTWIAHPDDAQPVIDFEFAGTGPPYDAASKPRIKISGPNIYLDGIKFTRSMTMAFQVDQGEQVGNTFRRCWFDQGGPGIEGGNSAFIMFVAAELAWSYATVIQDCEFSNLQVGEANSVVKMYTMFHALIEDCHAHDIEAYCEGFAIKAGIRFFTVRGCNVHDAARGVVGNMDLYVEADRCTGEVCFCNIKVEGGQPSYALEFNQHGEAREIHYYRCTIRGDILALNVETEDGPFQFDNCVIVNAESGDKIAESGVEDASRIVLNNNLTGVGADGILDANGLLQGSFRSTYLNQRGHEVAA
jgi:hypothetical protein